MRSSPSVSGSQVRLMAFGGEHFTQTDESNGWLRVSNARGSGWSYGTYWEDCALAGRSAQTTDGGASLPERAADGPTSGFDIPNWAFFLIGLVAGALLLAGVLFVVAIVARSKTSDKEQSLMEGKVGSAGSSTLIPQVRRRNSFGKL